MCTLIAAALVASLSFTAQAEAHDWRYHHTHKGKNAAIAAGIAGIIVGGIIANSNRNGRVIYRRDHCHGRYCHHHTYHGNHYHRGSNAVIYQQPRRVKRVIRAGLSNRHYRWCHAKYRSYRARDNSFQPYQGGRKACVSPYY
ncbi:MAG: BA14K family protein [Pseudomonadota bacterium]